MTKATLKLRNKERTMTMGSKSEVSTFALVIFLNTRCTRDMDVTRTCPCGKGLSLFARWPATLSGRNPPVERGTVVLHTSSTQKKSQRRWTIVHSCTPRLSECTSCRQIHLTRHFLMQFAQDEPPNVSVCALHSIFMSSMMCA